MVASRIANFIMVDVSREDTEATNCTLLEIGSNFYTGEEAGMKQGWDNTCVERILYRNWSKAVVVNWLQ